MQNNKTIQVKDSEKPKLILKTGNPTKICQTIPNQQKQLIHNTSTKKVPLPQNNKNLGYPKEQIKQEKLV